jgi:hypothetical protein
MTFEAILISVPDYPNAAYVEIPFNVETVFGKKGRIKVKASFNGIPYRGSIAKMGTPFYTLLVLKGIREKLNKKIGESITVTLNIDVEERKVDIPEFLVTEFKINNIAATFFNKLSYTHQKGYVNWLLSAKRKETKVYRLNKLVEMLNNKALK